MITVTEQAAAQIRVAAQQGGMEGMALRIAAARKNDGELEYRMGFDEARPDDVHIESEGIEIVVQPDSQPLLQGMVLDFVELAPGDRQFIFLNPNDPNFQPPEQK